MSKKNLNLLICAACWVGGLAGMWVGSFLGRDPFWMVLSFIVGVIFGLLLSVHWLVGWEDREEPDHQPDARSEDTKSGDSR